MSPDRSRAVTLSMAIVLSLAALGASAPVTAAESPEAAVQQLLDAVDSGNLAGLDELVCEAERPAVREVFDVGAALGMPEGAGSPLAALDFSIEDRSIELVEQQDAIATVRVSASMSVQVDEEQIRELVRRLLEAEGSPIAESDLDLMVPLMRSALGQGQEIDEQLDVVLEDGEWLICGGLGGEVDEAPGPSPSVSFAGLCGLVSLADINATGPDWLAFESSSGFEGMCTYSSAPDDYRALTINLGSERLDDYQAFYPDGVETSVAGRPAWQWTEQLYVGLDDGVLTLFVFPGEEPPTDFDAGAYLASIGELIVPSVEEMEAPERTPEPVVEANVWPDPDGPSLCEAAGLDEMSSLTGIDFGESFGYPGSCTYSAVSDDAYHAVSTNLYQLTLDELRLVFPDGEDLVIAGMPAYAQADQLWLELPGDQRLLGVGVFLSPGTTDTDATELGTRVAELVLPWILEQA